jgi:predicted acylesterase/phospholipase RssA
LSGGGSRGDFQLGALELLYERGVLPEILCGCSVGSINAAKLAEGENPMNSDRGLSGLRKLWCGMQRNSDMWQEEPWLTDPNMDQRIADALRGGEVGGVGITRPSHVSDNSWVMAPGVFLVNGIIDAAFLATDGQAVLRSLDIMLSTARSLFNLSPTWKLLQEKFDIPSVDQWAANGAKKLRLATVALESGALRYVTEKGEIVERNGDSVPDPTAVPPACANLASALAALKKQAPILEAEVKSAQEDLRTAAPGAKAAIAANIRMLKSDLKTLTVQIGTATAALAQCQLAHPTLPLVFADWRAGILASSSIPGIFPPVRLAGEWYVDGGVRECMPMQIAVDLGADTIYAIHASSRKLPPFLTPTTGGVFDIVSRSLASIAIDEIDLSDRLLTRAPMDVHHIEPNTNFHDIYVIDPGLIQIERDYGYMVAADVVDKIDLNQASGKRRHELSTELATLRFEIWTLEITAAGEANPTISKSKPAAPDPSLKQQIDMKKLTLKTLIDERRQLGGPMPIDIDYWTSRPERHPWIPREARLHDHLYTTSAIERELAVRQHDYVDEGVACYVPAQAAQGTVQLFRMTRAGQHFYTRSATERDAARPLGFQSEDMPCQLFDQESLPGLVPLYRISEPGTNQHLYTTSILERDIAVSQLQWIDEDIAGFVWPSAQPGSVPLYRMSYS